MRRRFTVLILIFIGLSTVVDIVLRVHSAPDEDANAEELFWVSEYDSARSVEDDIQAALPVAKKEGKRVLLFVGADWCGWCHRLSDLMHEKPEITSEISDHYVVVKVAYSSKNSDFLSQYPDFAEFPHLYVLGQDGALLHSQKPAQFQRPGGYREAAVLEFFEEWSEEAR